jgi:CxxC motif-containing protein (DUF1111 family)
MFDLIPHRKGGLNYVPSFITQYGPIREVRFQRKADGTPDGGVHQLFTIVGRSDIGAPGCTAAALPSTDFETQYRNGNLSFRIPLQTFGLGLIEAIQDQTILKNMAETAAERAAAGIAGMPNRSGNDGTITRFGWKAQNKSLLLFAGEAYNVEMGISNELFPTEREETASCQFGTAPNSVTNPDAPNSVDAMSSIERFASFKRLLAPPVPSTTTPGGATSIANGKRLFSSVGCTLCHTPRFTTGATAVTALANRSVDLYSDLLIHDMGVGLADGISQGGAGPREFRSAPLWGLGQRIFFLHDGRASDLVTAIRAHASTGSEANGVVANYGALSEPQKQDLLNFLRSL